MTCDHLQSLLPTLAYEDVSDEERSLAQDHLRGCAPCRESFAAWQRLRSTVPKNELPADEGFWMQQKASIMRRLPSADPVKRPIWRPLAPALVMTALAIGWWRHEQVVRRETVLVSADAEMLRHLELLQDLDLLQEADELDHA